jgi:hypothetical protein
MNKAGRRLAAVGVFSAMLATSALAEETEFVSLGCDANPRYTLYVVTVTDAKLKLTPSWQKEASDPPLSARKALKAANEFRAVFFKDANGWKWQFQSLSLRHHRREKWYWVAYYEADPINGGIGGGVPYCFVVVLMDGAIVQPVRKNSDDYPQSPEVAGPGSNSHAEGKFFMSIPGEGLGTSPVWNPAAEDPPLSARRAINLATAMKNTLVKDSTDHKWEFVALDLVPNDSLGRWCWEATFWSYKRPDQRTDDWADLRLFVLMDGKVDRPAVTRDPHRR